MCSSAVERPNVINSKNAIFPKFVLWNQENKPNVTIVVGYDYLVIIPRP